MSNVKLKPLSFHQNVSLGCDPEFFFADDRGDVIGSEKILGDTKSIGVIIDGVQAELNPGASSCRESLASGISGCFIRIRDLIANRGDNVTLKMDTLVDISERELNSLSDASRRFGCAPSTNIYNEGENKTSEIKANPATYLKRSAGGHIHMGNYYSTYLTDKQNPAMREMAERIEKALKKMPEVMVPILDIIVGNTCVLLDRQPGNIERRENYGRVGEFRIKDYGIEYRTLSNFWLRSYPLMSLVTGLCRFAVHIVSESTPGNDYVKALFDAVSLDDIVKAVNENDYDLAMKNFKAIQPIWLMAASGSGIGYWPLVSESSMKYFEHFAFRIQEKGLAYWFPQDVLKHWCGRYGAAGGWERWSYNVVAEDLRQFVIEKKVAIDLNARRPVSVSA